MAVLKQMLSMAGFGAEAAAIDRHLDTIQEFARSQQRALAPILSRDGSDEQKASAMSAHLSAGPLRSLFDRLAGEAAHPRERSVFSTARVGLPRVGVAQAIVAVLAIALLAYVEAWMLIAVIIGVIIAQLLTLAIQRAGTDALDTSLSQFD